jgi:glycosyltransferase involved in cell wall biosynthesis
MNLFISLNRDVRAEYEWLGIDSTKIMQFGNGVDTSQFYPVSYETKQILRDRLGLPKDQTIVLYAGRMAGRKRLDVLREAFIECASDAATPVVLGEILENSRPASGPSAT